MPAHSIKWLAVLIRPRTPHAPTFEVVSGISGQWHYRERASNGQIKASSETYASKSNAKRAAIAAAYGVPGSTVRVLDAFGDLP